MRRRQRIQIRLTDTEFECVLRLAKNSRQTLTAWVRTQILTEFNRQFPTLKSRRESPAVVGGK